MRLILLFIACVSVFALLVRAVSLGYDIGDAVQRRNAAAETLKTAQDENAAAKRRRDEARAAAREGEHGQFLLRDVIADIHLAADRLPEEIRLAEIRHAPAASTRDIQKAAHRDDSGAFYMPVDLVVSYSNYTALVAVVVGWFANSKLPISLEKVEIEKSRAKLSLRAWGEVEQ